MPGSKDPLWQRFLLAVAGAVLVLTVGSIWWGGNINARVAAAEEKADDQTLRLIRIEDSVAAIYRMMIERRE